MQQQLLLAWALLAAAGFSSLVVSVSCEEHHAHHHARKLYIRDLVDPSLKCRNTFNGPVNITDDKGMLCSRSDLDTQTGCCRTGTQHDCSKCMPYDQCCSEYEACVSCCLHPSNRPDKEAKERLKAEKHQSAGKWGDAFDFCRGACRTTGKSTAHENAYIGPRHHCFSQHGKPLLTGPVPEGAFDKALLAIGGGNENCDAVCAKWGAQSCSVELLKLLNNCDRLREWAACEAGCDTSGAVTGPLYVDPNAPKAERPAMCFVHPNPEALTCGAAAEHHHRLCGCTKKQ